MIKIVYGNGDGLRPGQVENTIKSCGYVVLQEG